MQQVYLCKQMCTFPNAKLMQNNQSVDDDDDENDDDASMTDQLLMSPLKTKWAISIIIFFLL